MSRQPSSPRAATVVAAALWVLPWVTSGCGVLTESQVGAVRRFGEATEQYGPLPEAVIDSYASAKVQDDWVLNVPGMRIDSEIAAARQQAEQNWSGLLQARELSGALAEQADRAGAALAVLDTYAELLTILASDQFTDNLETSAEALGAQLSKGVQAYNARTGGNLPDIGSIAAAAVRGAGGIYIRARQEQALKRLVPQADAAIAQLTVDVEALMASFLAEGGYLDVQSLDLGKSFERATVAHASSRKGPLPHQTVQAFSDALAQIDATRRLARQSKQAAATYRAAHGALVAAVQAPISVATAKEQIDTLSREITAARKLKKRLDDAQA